MLIQFSVENYRSFRDRVTLSMVPAKPDKSLPHNITSNAQDSGFDLLRSAAIFGANASGKSNLLRAMRFAADFVGTSVQERYAGEARIDVVPFKLDSRCTDQPSRFEFVFLMDGRRYDYGFAVDAKRVHEEWLHHYPQGRRRRLFVRGPAGRAGQTPFAYGADWKGERTQIEKLTRANALYLSVSAQFNHPIAQALLDWFGNRFREISWFPTEGFELAFTCDLALHDHKLNAQILEILRGADLGIADYDVKRIPITETAMWSHMPEELRTNILSASGPEPFVHDVRVLHHAVDENGREIEASFQFAEESDGTQKMFALAGPWQYVLQRGCVVVVDELDARLHPSLTKWLVRRFHSQELNPNGAQLIFATHDDNLLDMDLFRRDQIWFTEKKRDGATALYSLWDFKKPPRRETNIRRGYLSGRYGAVPFLEDLPT